MTKRAKRLLAQRILWGAVREAASRPRGASPPEAGMSPSKSKPPLIHVVMPALNQEEYVAEAIDSVTSQQWSNLRLTIINDGSVDRTGGIAREKAQRDPRVHVIEHNRTEGIPTSLAEAVNHRSADLFSFIGADDVWLPNLLVKQVRHLQSAPRAIATACDGWIIDAKGVRDGRLFSDLCQPVPDDEWGTTPAHLRRPHLSSIGMLVDYQAIRRIGFPRSLPFLFDWFLWLQVTIQSPVARNLEALYEYRIHGRNSSIGQRRLDAELPAFADVLEASGHFEDLISRHWLSYYRLRGWQHLSRRSLAWRELWRMFRLRPWDHKNLTQLSQMVLGESFNMRVGRLLGSSWVSRLQ